MCFMDLKKAYERVTREYEGFENIRRRRDNLEVVKLFYDGCKAFVRVKNGTTSYLRLILY